MCRMILFVVIHSIVFLNAQRDKKFFRNDYTYLEETDSFYKVHKIRKTWQDAKYVCDMEGATFFYPQDETEANVVLEFWKKTQNLNYFYIGVADLVVEGVFVTTDGIAIDDVYSKWRDGEPNNVNGQEHCVNLMTDGTLNDNKCDEKLSFICKKKRSMIKWNQFCNIPAIGYNYSETVGNCYKLHLIPRTWTDAFIICNAEHSYLAIVDSNAEAEYLKQLFLNAPKNNIVGDYLRDEVLLGFHNRNGDGWKTVKGTALENSAYSKWSYQQPDGGDDEKCGSMFMFCNATLNDVSCSKKGLFICEHDVPDQRRLFKKIFSGKKSSIFNVFS
ncbi:hypothetical protein evm_000439 [Chilo suppressalis]|nr:hypothetical protein evm_000387 [Chilo suppressalis]RVE55072.1 hypothetical protein evm_000439 [Chilo suppressalis]